MSGPRIDVDADVSGIETALQAIHKSAEKVTQALSGTVEVDTEQALQELKELEAAARDALDQLKTPAALKVDTSAAVDALDAGADAAGKLGKALDKLNKPVVVEVDAGAAVDALDAGAAAAGKLDKALKGAGKGKGGGSGLSEAAADAKRLEEQLRRAARVQEILARTTGMRISDDAAKRAAQEFMALAQPGVIGSRRLRQFSGLDDYLDRYRQSFVSDGDAAKHKAELLKRLGIELPSAPETPAPGEHGAAEHAEARKRGRGTAGRLSSTAGALGGVIGSMGTGGDGGVLAGAGNAAGSLAGAGLGMLFGGPVGMIGGAFLSRMLGSFGGAVDRGLGDAQNEYVNLADLRAQVGAVATEFKDLRDRLQYANHGLGLTNDEAVKLARSFAHAANIGGDAASSLADELRTAVDFGRGFGVREEQATGFMAEMRHAGVTRTEADSRRLAVMVGEAVTKGGNLAKADEVLAAVQNFVGIAARQSLAVPNVEAFTSMLSSLSGLKLPGMDVGAAASTLGKVNAAITRGGAFGEASQNFMLGVYARLMPGFDARDMEVLTSQGAMGSVRSAFGEGSNARAFALRAGDLSALARYDAYLQSAGKDGGTDQLTLLMRALRQRHGRDSASFAHELNGLFGTDMQESMALYRSMDAAGGLGGLYQDIRRFTGKDMDSLNVKSVAMLAQLRNAGRADLLKHADTLGALEGPGRLLEGERRELDAARSGNDPERLREVVMRLSASRDVTVDEGQRTRQTIADVKNAITEFAQKLIPLTNMVRDGVTALAEKFAPDSDFVKSRKEAAFKTAREEAAARAGLESWDGSIKQAQTAGVSLDDLTKLRQARAKFIEGLRQGAAGQEHSPEFIAWLQALDGGSATERDEAALVPGTMPAGGRRAEGAMSDRSAEAHRYFVAQGWTPAQAAGLVANLQAESGLDPKATGDGGKAAGIAQWHPDRQRVFLEKYGKPVQDATLQEQLAFVHHELTEGNEQVAGQALRQARTAADAGAVVSRQYERPKNADVEAMTRARLAHELLRQVSALDSRNHFAATDPRRIDLPLKAPTVPKAPAAPPLPDVAQRLRERTQPASVPLPAAPGAERAESVPRLPIDKPAAELPADRKPDLGTLSRGDAAQQPERLAFSFEHRVVLQDPSGIPLHDPIVQTQVHRPRAAGVR